MYRDWENIIHFSFFVKQFLSPSQKIIIPKQCIKKEIGFFSYHRNKNIFANTIKSDINMNVSCLIGTVFFSCIYTKGGRKRSQLFKETTWVVKQLRHWSVCKCNDVQTWFSMPFWRKLWFQYITWIVFFW